MNRILLFFVIVAIVVTAVTSCNKTNSVASSTLRVFNVDPAVQPQDMYLNGQIRVAGLTYGSDTNYVAIQPGTYNIKIAPTSTTTYNTDYNIDFSAGKNYMMFLLNIGGALQTEAFDENFQRLGFDTAEFRLLPFSPDAPAMNLLIKSDTASFDTTYTIFTGRYFNDAYATRTLTQFRRITSGPYTVKMQYRDTDSTLVTRDSIHVNFLPGASYTVYTRGYFSGSLSSPFKIDTLRNN